MDMRISFMNNKFYCYSNRLKNFLTALRFEYMSVGTNKNTNKDYWVYQKSGELDEAIAIYNSIKHKFE